MFGSEARDKRIDDLERLVFKFAKQVETLEDKIKALTTVTVPYNITVDGLHISSYVNYETMRLDIAVSQIINHLGLRASLPKPPEAAKLVLPDPKKALTEENLQKNLQKKKTKRS